MAAAAGQPDATVRSLDDDDQGLAMDYAQKAKRIPHYALPNVAAILPDYANIEQETIGQAFRAGNFTYLQAVPNQVNPNFIAKAKASEQEWTRKSGFVDQTRVPFSPAKAPSRHTVFQEFEYIPSLYTLSDELRSEERKQKTLKQQEVAGAQPFVCSDTAARLKYEEGYASFTRPSERTQEQLDAARYPYPENPYEAADDLAARTRWLHTNMFVGGPMVPSGRTEFLKKPTLAMLPEIVETLQRMVSNDWPELEVMVQVTDDGLISISFPMDGLESDFGVLAYMNTRANANDIIEKFVLHKCVDKWNVRTSDNKAHFFFRPPWLPAGGQGATMFELHPDTKRAGPLG